MGSSPFLNTIRREIRLRGYSMRTEKAYLGWIKRYIHYYNLRHPQEMGASEVRAFLSYLANERDVAINTQKTALNALAFLYHKVLNHPLGDLDFTHAKQHRRLPTVLAPAEVQKIITQLQAPYRLIFSILYGSGLRITECLRLRVKDVDFDRCALTVTDGKGGKDRKTILSQSLLPSITEQIEFAHTVQQKDNLTGHGPSLPHALHRKYPNAFRQLNWMYLFPQRLCATIPLPSSFVDTTSMTLCRVSILSQPSQLLGYITNASVVIRSAILSPLNCCRQEKISVPFRSYSAIVM